MVRRTLVELNETIEESKKIYFPIGAQFNEQKKQWAMPNGSRLRFAYLDRDADAEGYQGHSYTRVYVEEIGNFPRKEPVMKLMATLRSGHRIPCGFRATGNPGGPGHQWVKERYIDPAPLGYTIIEERFRNPYTGDEQARERVFIPSRLSDNKYLGSEYVANLQLSGSPELVRAWLEGDWSVIAGAYFPEFSLPKHVMKPFKIPEHWTRIMGFDWGYSSPFAAVWVAIASEDCQVPKGAAVVYREWYGATSANVGAQLKNEDIGDGIRKRCEGEKVQLKRADPSIFKVDGGTSIGEQIKCGFQPADNSRLAGWSQIRSRLVGAGGKPMLYLFDSCPNTIRTLPALQHDTIKPEDLDTDGEDHAADALRYALMSRPYARPSVTEKKPLKGIESTSLNDLWERQRRQRRA
jgi:hypothetical protein